MLCGPAPICNCYMETLAATEGAIDGEFPTITVTGDGDPTTPWVLTLNPDWAELVADFAAPGPWIPVTFQNGWDNYALDDDWQPAAYRKIGDMVYVRGLIARTGSSSGVVAFTLPVGYRPPATSMYPAVNHVIAHGRVDVSGGGTVTPYYVATDATYFSLNHVRFSITA